MIMGDLFERFLAESPICVMQRALLENVFAPELLDNVFRSAAVRQYERELLFSQLVDVTSLVVCRVQPSVIRLRSIRSPPSGCPWYLPVPLASRAQPRPPTRPPPRAQGGREEVRRKGADEHR